MEKLSVEVMKTNIDTKNALDKVNMVRRDITHIYNIHKIEEDLSIQRMEE